MLKCCCFLYRFVQLLLCHQEGYESQTHTYTTTYPSTFSIYHKQQLTVCKQSLMNIFVTTLTTVKIKIPTLKQWLGEAVHWSAGLQKDAPSVHRMDSE